MATLKDIWGNTNAAQGNVADTANWSGDNSFGVDKRVDDMLTGTYRSWPSINPRTTLSTTTLAGSQAISNYMAYFDSFVEDTNLTFNQIQKHPTIEHTGQPKSNTVATLEVKAVATANTGVSGVFAAGAVIEITTTVAHGLSNGDQLNFFGFGGNYAGLNGISATYAKVIDTTKVQLYSDSGLTTRKEIDGINVEQADHMLVAQNDGSFDGCLIIFDGANESYVTGDTLDVLYKHNFANFSGIDTDATNIYNLVADTKVYLEKVRNNVYKMFTNVGRTTPVTHKFILPGFETEQYHLARDAGTPSHDLPFTMSTSGNDTHISVDLDSYSDTTTLLAGIRSQRFQFPSGTGDIYRGLCRVQLTQGTSPGKTIPTTMDTSEFFVYEFDDATDILTLFENPTDSQFGSMTQLKANHATSITGNIRIINFWTHRNFGYGSLPTPEFTFDNGKFYNKYTVTGAAVTNVGGDWTGQPLMDLDGEVYDGTYANNTNKLFYEFADPTMLWPGIHSYNYQNSSNVKTYASDGFDFTSLYRKGYNFTSTVTPTYITTPVIGADVNGSGYLDNTYTYTNRGKFKILNSGGVDGTLTSTTDNRPTIGLFKVKFKADEYVAPTPYAPDQFDTDDEWDSDGFDTRKNWPNTITPNGIKITMVQPSSITRSQNGTKYVRTAGIVKHQLEVSYPPMTYDNFREYEAVVQAARGQATPFYFNIKDQNGSYDLLFNRTDQYATSYITTTRVRNTVALGSKTILVEGFEANQPDVFVRGEALIVGGVGSANGNIVQVINDNVDSNIYGEAKFRIAHGSNTTLYAYDTIYKNPLHLIVTLAEDNLEYTIGTDGLYRMTCMFDLDEFK